jgi:hypothetical protein
MSGKNPGKSSKKSSWQPPPQPTLTGPLLDQLRGLGQLASQALQQNQGVQRVVQRVQAVASVITAPPPAGNSAAQVQTAQRLGQQIEEASEKVEQLAERVQGQLSSANQRVQQIVSDTASAGGQLFEVVQASLNDTFPVIEENPQRWMPPVKTPVTEPELTAERQIVEQAAKKASERIPAAIAATSELDSKIEAQRLAKIQQERDAEEKRRRQKEIFEQIVQQVRQDLTHIGSYQEFKKIYSNERIPRDVKVLLHLDDLNASLKRLNDGMIMCQQGFVKAQKSLEEIGKEVQRLAEVQTELRKKQEELQKLVDEEQREQEEVNPFSDPKSLELRRSTIQSLQATTTQLSAQLKEWTKLQTVSKDMSDMQENTPQLLELYKLAFRRTLLCAMGDSECESIKQRIEEMLKQFPRFRSSMYGLGRKTRRRKHKRRKTKKVLLVNA